MNNNEELYPCRCCGEKPNKTTFSRYINEELNIIHACHKDDFTMFCSNCGANTIPYLNDMAIHKWQVRNEKHNPFMENNNNDNCAK